jgi:hypothetical protein
VVERHGDADPVGGRKVLALADVEGVEQQVAVRERGGFGKTGGAGRVLDVDRVARLEVGADAVHVGLRHGLARGKEFFPRQQAGWRRTFDGHDAPQPRVCRRLHGPLRGGGNVGANLGQHGEVVRRFELIDEEQGDAVALVEHVLQLVGAVGRVDRHHHRADPGRGELEQHPLRHVRRPDGDVLAFLDTESQ